jgi:hypothetical protein
MNPTVYSDAEKAWLKRHGYSDDQIATQATAGVGFLSLLALITGLLPDILTLIQKLINLFSPSKQ